MGLRFGISFSCPNKKSPLLNYNRSSYYEIIGPQIDGDWLEWKIEDFFKNKIAVRIDAFYFFLAIIAFIILNNDNFEVIKDEMIILRDRAKMLNIDIRSDAKLTFCVSEKYFDIDQEYNAGNKDLQKIMEDIENFGAKLNFDMELEIRDWE